MNEAEIAGGCFVVACRQPAGAFEFVEAALAPVPQGLCDGIDGNWFPAGDFAGDDGCAAALFDDTADVVAVVATVGNDHFGFGKIVVAQRIEAFEI